MTEIVDLAKEYDIKDLLTERKNTDYTDYRTKDSIEELKQLMLEWGRDMDSDFVNEFLSVYADADKWDGFCKKHNINYVPLEKCPDEIDAVEVIETATAEEADDLLISEGKLVVNSEKENDE